MALHEIRAGGEADVVALLTTVTEGFDRISMHGVRRVLLERQARSIGVELREVRIPPSATNVQYQASLDAVLLEYRDRGIETVAFGDLFLEDIRRYREENLGRLGMRGLYPIWKRDTAELARTFLRLGFRAIVVCVDPRKLEASFAGEVIDEAFLARLPAGVDPCGENGEFHTFVFDGPIFRAPVRVVTGAVVERDGFVFCDLLPEG